MNKNMWTKKMLSSVKLKRYMYFPIKLRRYVFKFSAKEYILYKQYQYVM